MRRITKMKRYKIYADGFFIGVCELSKEDVLALASDSDIVIKEV